MFRIHKNTHPAKKCDLLRRLALSRPNLVPDRPCTTTRWTSSRQTRAVLDTVAARFGVVLVPIARFYTNLQCFLVFSPAEETRTVLYVAAR